jgi:hypothetical protein
MNVDRSLFELDGGVPVKAGEVGFWEVEPSALEAPNGGTGTFLLGDGSVRFLNYGPMPSYTSSPPATTAIMAVLIG